MKKLILLVVVLIAIGGGIYCYQVKKNIINDYPASSQAPDLARTSTPLSAPTADWKTYTRNNMYEFNYPTYGKIEETNSVVTDTTVVLTDDWMNTFDVTTHPEEVFCKSNPYSSIKNAVKEDIVTKYGNAYRHLHNEDSSSPTKTITEDRYYKFKGDTCYMIVLRTSEKVGSQIVADIEKIFSTFKFAN